MGKRKLSPGTTVGVLLIAVGLMFTLLALAQPTSSSPSLLPPLVGVSIISGIAFVLFGRTIGPTK